MGRAAAHGNRTVPLASKGLDKIDEFLGRFVRNEGHKHFSCPCPSPSSLVRPRCDRGSSHSRVPGSDANDQQPLIRARCELLINAFCDKPTYELLGVYFPSANAAIERLLDTDILGARMGYRRDRVFLALEALRITNRPFGAEPEM